MKKISLLLVVLLAAGSAGLYGQMAIGTEFSISGDAKATLGYDLDARQLGFKNEFSSDISLTLVPEMSSSKSGDGSGWVGVIELNDFRLIIDDGHDDANATGEGGAGDTGAADGHTHSVAGHTHVGALVVDAADVVAKLVNGPLSLTFHSAPGNVAGKVDAVENDDDDDDDYTSEDEDKDLHHDRDGAGVAFGYNTDDLGITLGITSQQPHDSGTKGDWNVSADVSVDVGPATVELQIVQEINGNNIDEHLANSAGPDAGMGSTGVAAKISGDVGDLSLSAAVDVELRGVDDVDDPEDDTNESLNWEFGVSAGFDFTDSTSFDAAFIYSSLPEVGSDIKVTLTDDGGLVENLSLALTWGLFDLANGSEEAGAAATMNNKMDMLVKADVSYGVSALGGTLSPGFEVTVNQIDSKETTADVTVELVLTETIPMAELGLAWNTKSLFDDTNNDVGTLTAWTKVAY